MAIGSRIRDLRWDAHLNQRELARRAGIAQNTLSQIELGKTTPSVPTLEKLARELGIEASELLQEPVPLADASEAGPTREAGEAADLRRLRQALWLQLRELLEAAGAVRTEASRFRLGEVLEVLEELDNVEKRMAELAPEPLATIVMRLDEPTEVIYHRDPTDAERARLRREYPDALEVEARETALVYA
jgi:transcriptional regulator with XRE-family HTH domain